MTVILFLVILAILVLVHEFGHFFAAKRLGIRVDEFGLGFSPRIWGKKIGETMYSINWIPFGGFVRIFGETPDDSSISGPDSERSFARKPKWAQALVLSAGVIMNVVFAWLLFSVALSSGLTTSVSSKNASYIENVRVLVTGVMTDSPAKDSGIRSGDSIVAIRSRGATTTVSSIEKFQEEIQSSRGGMIGIDVIRGDADKTPAYIRVIPERGLVGDDYAIGVSLDMVGEARLPFHRALLSGAVLTYDIGIGIASHLASLVTDLIRGEADLSGIAGPVGIAGLVGDASRLGIIYLLSFTAFISLNLAVLNLIPFPALDGGRLVFVAIEAIMRRPIPPRVANTVNAVGFGILILFMLIVTYRDIVKLF